MTIASALLKVPALIVLAAAASQAPVAVVEDVSGNPGGLQMMDYVVPGQVIHLGPADSMVLSYLSSCVQETITGGAVTVGTDHSDIVGGNVQRQTIRCEGGKTELTRSLADKSGAMALREIPQGYRQEIVPQVTLYGRSPVVEVNPVGALVIERLDQPGERHDVILGDAQLVQGRFLDLSTAGVVLAPDGIYTARVGMQQIVFKVDHDARAGKTPIAGRLLQLQPH